MQLHRCTFDPHGRTMYTIVYCCDLVRSKFPFCIDYFSTEKAFDMTFHKNVADLIFRQCIASEIFAYLAIFRHIWQIFESRDVRSWREMRFFTYTDGWTSVIIDRKTTSGIFIASCPLTTRAADTYTCICTCTWPVSRDAWRERSRSTRNLAHSERNIPSGALKTTGT